MPRRPSKLTEALQRCRDLQNRVAELEFPLQRRIRELETELAEVRNQAAVTAERNGRLERGMEAAMAFILWLLSSGKAR